MNTRTSVAAAKSRDDAPTGSAGVPPAQHWHSLTRLRDPARPATAHDSASAEPMGFPPVGWPGAASQGNRAARNGSACGRDARAPGGAPPPILLALRGGTAPADAAEPFRLVCLRRPSRVFVDHSLFRLFQESLLQKYREALGFGRVLPIRRIRGWVGAEPIRAGPGRLSL